MRVNANVFWVLAVFFAIVAVAYTVWSYIDYSNNPLSELKNEQGIEWVGTVALALSSVMSVFLAFYIAITRRAQGGELVEDIPTAEIDDGDPEIGHFSPWSWWPFVLGLGLALLFLGLAVGIWIMFIGAPIVVIAIVGWQYEYYRNFFAR